MAVKKAAKKAPKKAVGEHNKHQGRKDLRRAYEHLGRLEALEQSLPKDVRQQIAALTEFGRQSLVSGDANSSAELLRACEHIAFGSLAPNRRESVDAELRKAIEGQYDKLREEAIDEWHHHGDDSTAEIRAAFAWTLGSAEKSYDHGSFRRALEMIRAAAALAQVRGEGLGKLPAGGRKILRGS